MEMLCAPLKLPPEGKITGVATLGVTAAPSIVIIAKAADELGIPVFIATARTVVVCFMVTGPV
jgi:hypothetical protein